MKSWLCILVLIVCSFLNFGCDDGGQSEGDVVVITSIEPSIQGRKRYDDSKEYLATLTYNVGDTIHFDIEIDNISGFIEYVDIALTTSGGYPYYYDFDSYERSLKQPSDESYNNEKTYHFEYYYFKEGHVTIDFEYVIPLDFTFSEEENREEYLFLSLYFGDQYFLVSDRLYVTIKIIP